MHRKSRGAAGGCGRLSSGIVIVTANAWGAEREQAQRLAGELRRLRDLSGLSGRELARRMGTSQSKVSRIESATTLPSVPEVTAWASAIGASTQVHDSLVTLAEAAFTEEQSWRDALRRRPHAQDEVRALESRARLLSTFQPSLVPGMLQTAEYARRVFSFLPATLAESDIPAAVAGRLNRQLALYEADRYFSFLITEGALRWRPGPPELMVAQLDRIASVSTLDNVSVGVIPLGVQAVTMLTHTFVIYNGWDEQDILVEVDTIHARLLVKRPADVALYRQRWERLTQMAIFEEEAREFISLLSAGLRGRSG
jgi:transcriptional regulator with XRE-family HTH domain